VTAALRLARSSTPPVAVALAAFGLMAAAQALIPFVDDSRLLTTVVVAAFFATTAALAGAPSRSLSDHRRSAVASRLGTGGGWPWGRVAAAAGAVVFGTFLLEWLGSTTGWPFGAYHYTDALQPQAAGVPLVVPLAWFAMAVPAREVAARLVRPGWARVVLAAVALTAWDVMLDPQMVAEGFWVWEADGPWRGIPLSNYAGWLVSSAAVMVMLDRLLPDPGRSRGLLALYTWWAVTEVIAFLVFFGDPLVGVVGAVAMLPLAALAWRAELVPGAGAGRAGDPAPARGPASGPRPEERLG
jgi:hypothetical protein